jgi:hypothetical protein
MAGPNCQAGLGKDGAARSLGEQWLLKKGEGKEVSTGAVVPGRGGAVLEHGNLFKAGLPFWLIHKMATLLFYHSPIFSLIMMRELRIRNWGEALVS